MSSNFALAALAPNAIYSTGNLENCRLAGDIMNRIIVAAGALCALALSPIVRPAIAADLPVKPGPAYKAPAAAPAPNWNGWYLGGHAGYLWGETTVWDDGILVEKDAKTNGFVGGLLTGFNWQTGSWVLSLEGDFGWTNAHGTGNNPSPPPPPIVNHYDFNWTSHIRGRVGYAFDNVLVFVAGGLALADFDYSQTTGIQRGTVYTGWTIGGGFDYIFYRNWIVRLEYLHDEFGSKNYLIDAEPYRVKLTGDTVRGALMYKF
jgi:outer membrane immunogenic protein